MRSRKEELCICETSNPQKQHINEQIKRNNLFFATDSSESDTISAEEYEALVRAAGGHHHGPGSPPSWLTVTRDFGQDSGRGDGGATLDRAGFRGLMTRMSRELGEDIDDLCRRLTRALEQQDR